MVSFATFAKHESEVKIGEEDGYQKIAEILVEISTIARYRNNPIINRLVGNRRSGQGRGRSFDVIAIL